jgi:hypothetical protein
VNEPRIIPEAEAMSVVTVVEMNAPIVERICEKQSKNACSKPVNEGGIMTVEEVMIVATVVVMNAMIGVRICAKHGKTA